MKRYTNKGSIKTRITSLFLAIAMILVSIPLSVFANIDDDMINISPYDDSTVYDDGTAYGIDENQFQMKK